MWYRGYRIEETLDGVFVIFHGLDAIDTAETVSEARETIDEWLNAA
jgi:hypothetical protein